MAGSRLPEKTKLSELIFQKFYEEMSSIEYNFERYLELKKNSSDKENPELSSIEQRRNDNAIIKKTEILLKKSQSTELSQIEKQEVKQGERLQTALKNELKNHIAMLEKFIQDFPLKSDQNTPDNHFHFMLQARDLYLNNPDFKQAFDNWSKQENNPPSIEMKASMQPHLQELATRINRSKIAFDYTIKEIDKQKFPPSEDGRFQKAMSLVSAIDLSKPIKIINIKEGTILAQAQQEQRGNNRWIGDFFTSASATDASTEKGIASITTQSIAGAIHSSFNSSTKVKYFYELQQPTTALVSTARAAVDTWSLKNSEGNSINILTTGGAEQIYAPMPQSMKKEALHSLSRAEAIHKEAINLSMQIKDLQSQIKNSPDKKDQLNEKIAILEMIKTQQQKEGVAFIKTSYQRIGETIINKFEQNNQQIEKLKTRLITTGLNDEEKKGLAFREKRTPLLSARAKFGNDLITQANHAEKIFLEQGIELAHGEYKKLTADKTSLTNLEKTKLLYQYSQELESQLIALSKNERPSLNKGMVNTYETSHQRRTVIQNPSHPGNLTLPPNNEKKQLFDLSSDKKEGHTPPSSPTTIKPK